LIFQIIETHLLLPRSWDQIRGVRCTAPTRKEKDCFAVRLSIKPVHWDTDLRRNPHDRSVRDIHKSKGILWEGIFSEDTISGEDQMTHEDRGHYAAKHPLGRSRDQRIVDALTSAVSDNTIPCAVAFRVATELDESSEEVGFTIDTLEYTITKCQLGLFGYGEEKRKIKPADSVSPTLEEAIKKALINDRLPCASAWDIAERLGLGKLSVASACETLGIKISPCQLGAFRQSATPRPAR
jgi:hypothetical protein